MMFLGCDDLLLPDFVATVRAAHERFPDAAIIQPGVRVIDDDGRPTDTLGDRVKRAIRPRAAETTVFGGEPLVTSLLHGDWLYWPSLVFRTEAVRGPAFRDDLPIIQDLALVVDLVTEGATLVLDPTVVFEYRRHTQSASATSLLTGRRLRDERRYYAIAARQMEALGWDRARSRRPVALDLAPARPEPAAGRSRHPQGRRRPHRRRARGRRARRLTAYAGRLALSASRAARSGRPRASRRRRAATRTAGPAAGPRPAAAPSARGRVVAVRTAAAIEAPSCGSNQTAASPAISRCAAMSEQSTGTPAWSASRTGRPNPSTNDGSTIAVASR